MRRSSKFGNATMVTQDDFERQVARYFSFLVNEFGFESHSARPIGGSGGLGFVVEFTSTTVKISIDLSIHDCALWTHLIRGQHGVFPEYLDQPQSWMYLDALAALPEYNWTLDVQPASQRIGFTLDDVDRILRDSAQFLKSKCVAILKGDLTDWDRLQERLEAVVYEHRRAKQRKRFHYLGRLKTGIAHQLKRLLP